MVIHKWGAFPILSVPLDPGLSGRHRCELASLSSLFLGKKIKEKKTRRGNDRSIGEGQKPLKNTQKTTKLYSGVQNTGSLYDPDRSGNSLY